jgi:hypothetical protein
LAIQISKGAAGELVIHCDTCDSTATHNPASGSVVVRAPVTGVGDPTPPAGRKPRKKAIDPGGVAAFTIKIKCPNGPVSIPVDWPDTGAAVVEDFHVEDFSDDVIAAINGTRQNLTWSYGPDIPLARIADRVAMRMNAPVKVEVLAFLPADKLKK